MGSWERFAEVWFKPEGEPLALTFRIPQESFHIPGMGQLLTADNLLKAANATKKRAQPTESNRSEGRHRPALEYAEHNA